MRLMRRELFPQYSQRVVTPVARTETIGTAHHAILPAHLLGIVTVKVYRIGMHIETTIRHVTNR